jgi:tRNA nucleotidyltransferase/poly(A) polymerase
MSAFNKIYNKYITEAEKLQKLDNFSQVLSDNPDLKIAMELCLEIEAIEQGAEAIVVGGSVRDILLGKKPKDIDIATNVDIDTIASTFHTADIGKSKDFGIVAVLYKKMVFEVAHYREDEYQGDTDSRHPSSVKLTKSFEGDSSRRDITINSLGLRTDGTIVDYQGGLDDIKKGVIKAVGMPKDRFIEDALRMMRVGRFMARYGFTLDPETKNAIIELKELIKKIAPERIREELFKSASRGSALATYIEHLKEVGLLQLILPEIAEMDTLEQLPEHHPEGNVFAHTMSALRTSKSNDPLVNMAILFHDIGKLVTKTYAPDTNKVRYHGHEGESNKVFDNVANRLKFTNEQKEAILFSAQHHMIGHKLDEVKKSRLLNLRQNKNWDTLKHTIYADEASRGATKFDPTDYEKRMNQVEDVTKKFGEKQEFEKKMSGFVDGRLIMNLVPLIKGTDIGKIKDTTREWIITQDFNVSSDDVVKYVKHLGRELGYNT